MLTYVSRFTSYDDCLTRIMSHTACVTRHVSHGMSHTACLTLHVSHGMSHTACVTRHGNFLKQSKDVTLILPSDILRRFRVGEHRRISSSVSKGISPLIMMKRSTPMHQLSSDQPWYRWCLIHSGGEYTLVPWRDDVMNCQLYGGNKDLDSRGEYTLVP